MINPKLQKIKEKQNKIQNGGNMSGRLTWVYSLIYLKSGQVKPI